MRGNRPSRTVKKQPSLVRDVSIMIPVLLTGLVVKLIAIRDLPPTGIQRIITSDKKVEITSNDLMVALRPPVLASYHYYTPGSMSSEELRIEL
jgi:hypothetical protein